MGRDVRGHIMFFLFMCLLCLTAAASSELSGPPTSSRIHRKCAEPCCWPSCFVQMPMISLQSHSASNTCRPRPAKGAMPASRRRVLSLRCSEEEQNKDREQKTGKETLPDFVMQEMFKSLKQRRQQVDDGAGRVYLVCTQLGFLNVHSDPSDPTRLDNVVSALAQQYATAALKAICCCGCAPSL
jgi:hypothetical protein